MIVLPSWCDPQGNRVCPLSDNSEQFRILAWDGLSANKPKRTFHSRWIVVRYFGKSGHAIMSAFDGFVQRIRHFMKALVAATAVWSALITSPSTAANGIQPGLWKVTTVVLNNGEKLPPQSTLRCLTAEQASNLADTFSPRFGGINTSCERTQYEKSEQKMTWRLQCKGQVNMDSVAEFSFPSSIRYTATISTKSWMADQLTLDSHVMLEGEYVGACP
jgi:hypothetical protein